MAYPIIELAAQAMKTQLETIKVSSGYENTVNRVIRPRRTSEGNRPLPLDIWMLQDDLERDEDNDLAGNPAGIGWKIPFALDCVIRQAESSNLPMDQVINSFVADVQKALMEDITWGGIATDTRLGMVEFASSESGFEGATVWVEVLIRVEENNPFNTML